MIGLPTTIEAELEKQLNEYLDQDFDCFEDDYSSNMPCDNSGVCAGTSCTNWIHCHK